MVNLLDPWHVEEVMARLRDLEPSLDYDLLWEKWQAERSGGSDLVFRQRLLKLVYRLTERCTRCALHRNRTCTVRTDGTVYANLLVVGEAPGYSEDRSGLPFLCKTTLLASRCGRCSHLKGCHGYQLVHQNSFLGRKPHEKPACTPDEQGQPPEFDRMRTAGQLLSDLFRQLELERASWGDTRSPVAVSNAVRCHPVAADGISNQQPGSIHIMSCSRWLELEALLIQPWVTVALGEIAMDAILGAQTRFNPYSSQWFIRKPPYGIVLKTYHPSHLIRNGQSESGPLYDHLYRTMKLALWCATGRREPNPWENPYLLLKSDTGSLDTEIPDGYTEEDEENDSV